MRKRKIVEECACRSHRPERIVSRVTTIVDHKITPQPYGGYIIPGSTLENLNIFVSQWNTLTDARGIPIGAPYNTQHIIANVKPSRG